MASEFHRNAIITGIVNSFCLACECFLRTEFDITKHVEMPEHQKKINSYPYFEKYRNERIRKVKKGYYCEFCNLLMSTASKVSIHLMEIVHKKNKGIQLLKPSENAVVAYGDIIISEKAWHGLMDDTCAICNTEFEDGEIHKTETTHLLNLVQSKIEFGENNYVYRNTDEDTFQCLTCNAQFALKIITKHFTDPEHHKLYDSCRSESKLNDQRQNKTTKWNQSKSLKIDQHMDAAIPKKNYTDVCTDDFGDNIVNDMNRESETAVRKNQNQENILNSIARYQTNEININFETETAFCKKCFKHITFHFEDIKRHIEEHKKCPNNIEPSLSYPSNVDKKYSRTILVQKTNKETTSSQTHPVLPGVNQSSLEDSDYKNAKSDAVTSKDKNNKELTENSASSAASDDACSFAIQNNITYDGKFTFCRICQTRLPSSMQSMMEHVSGKYHKSKFANITSNEPELSKKPLKDFIDYTLTIKNGIHRKQSDQVINGKFCISYLSFFMMTKTGLRLRCQLCEVSLSEDDIDLHNESQSHKNAMLNTPVVISLKTEIVREVRPGLFHCGYCNLIVPNWTEFIKHVKCNEHRENKRYCMFRLERYTPLVTEYRIRQKIEKMMMLSLFSRIF